MAGVSQTTIVYCVEGEQVPYRVMAEIDPQELTLAKFKFSTKRFNYRFFFLSFDQEFGSLKDELSDDSAVCPSCRGLVQAWLLPLDLSEDTSKLSPMTGTPKNLTGLSEANTGVSTNESSSDPSRIISGCSSSSGQHASTGTSKLQPKQPRILGGFMTSSPTSWVRGDEQRCRSAEMYREHQRQENTREVLSDTCAELMVRGQWNYDDVFDGGSGQQVGCSEVHRVHGQQGGHADVHGVEGHIYVQQVAVRGKDQHMDNSSAPDIERQTHQISCSIKPGPGVFQLGAHSDAPGLHNGLCEETEDVQLQMSTESEGNIKAKKFSDSFNFAFFEEKTPREFESKQIPDDKKEQVSETTTFQTVEESELCSDIKFLQLSDHDETNKSDVSSLPLHVSLRSDELYPTSPGMKPSNLKTNLHSFQRKKNKPPTSEMHQRQGKQSQFSKKLERGSLQQFSSDKEWLKLKVTKDCLPSYSEACTQLPSHKHDVSTQEPNQCQSFCNSRPCSFCENLCPVYQSVAVLYSERQTDAKVSTSDIFSVSPLQRSLNNSEACQEITAINSTYTASAPVASLQERDGAEPFEHVEHVEESLSMRQPLIGREQHLDTKEKVKKRDETDSIEGSSVLQSLMYEQHAQPSLIDTDLRETFAAMTYCQIAHGPEFKDRKWLGCVIPNAVIGKDLTQWLMKYRPGCANSKAAKAYAQKMLDRGVIRSFLSSEVTFKEQWYYTAVDSW